MASMEEGAGEPKRGGVAASRLALDSGATREAKTEKASDLVKRLASGIVERGTKEFEIRGTAAVEEAGVAAADDEADAGENVAPGSQAASIDVRLDVVDTYQRHLESHR